MSHDTTHTIADKPKTSSVAAFFAVLIFIGFILGLINFTQSMSHDDGGHGSAAHAAEHKGKATHEAHGAAHKETGAAEHH